MFCKTCGNEVNPEAGNHCTVCGAIVESGSGTTPVPGTEPLPESFPGSLPVKKSMGIKPFLIGGIALVVVLVIGLLLWNFTKGDLVKTFSSPKDYYLFLEKENMSQTMATLLKTQAKTPNNFRMTNELTVTDLNIPNVPSTAVGVIKGAKLITNSEIDAKTLTGNADMAMLTGGVELFKVNASSNGNKVGFNLPGVNNQYIYYDFTAYKDAIMKSMNRNWGQTLSEITGLSESQFGEMIVKYAGEIMVNNIESANIVVDNNSTFDGFKCTSIKVTYDEALMKKIALAIIGKLKTDTAVKDASYKTMQYMSSYYTSVMSLNPSSYSSTNPYNMTKEAFDLSYNSGLTMMESQLNSSTSYGSSSSMPTIISIAYTDGSAKILGREITIMSGTNQVGKATFRSYQKDGKNFTEIMVDAQGVNFDWKNSNAGAKNEGSITYTIPSSGNFSANYNLEKKDVQGIEYFVGNIKGTGNLSGYSSGTGSFNLDILENTPGTSYTIKMSGNINAGMTSGSVGINLNQTFTPLTGSVSPMLNDSNSVDYKTVNWSDYSTKVSSAYLSKFAQFGNLFGSSYDSSGYGY
ncbi:MAG: hypothetical protein WCQ41_01190 [Bacillota bacterium]